MELKELKQLAVIAIDAAVAAGNEILKIYDREFTFWQKEDKTPLTIADKKSHEVIAAALQKTTYPVLSEEGKKIPPYEERKSWKHLWLVDPLDGTKEFIKKNGEFTVNIAFIENNTPVMGLIYIPVQECIYFSIPGLGAYKRETASEIRKLGDFDNIIASCEKLPLEKKSDTYNIIASRSHLSPETQAYIRKMEKEHEEVAIISAGSALKFCLLAEGKADVYPRFAPTMEWDTASGHAILMGVGKQLIDKSTRQPMIYNRKNLKNNWFLAK